MEIECSGVTDLSDAPAEIKETIIENDNLLKSTAAMPRTKLVYICSRYQDDPEVNIIKAQEYCKEAMEMWPDVIPVAPHVYFTQFLDDSKNRERKMGMDAGRYLMALCDEVWVFGMDNPSGGMAAEIALATGLGIKIVDAVQLYSKTWKALPNVQVTSE